MKPTKYNSKKTEIDGFKFDSLIEADYYLHLKNLKEKGEILAFGVHPRYLLQDKFKIDGEIIHAIYYIADFEVKHNDYSISVIDIKGMPTEVAKLKRKMFLMVHGAVVDLLWITRYKGEFVDYFKNEARRKANKKEKAKKD